VSSGLYSYTTPPATGACWICTRTVQNTSRQGKIPALCGTNCETTWRATYGLDIATHTADGTEWVPIAARPRPAPPAPVGKPGSWINRNPQI
jgi:hypothetical protein